jgi:ankyrin repeat protein
LHVAILQGDQNIVRLLLDYGADVNIAAKEGTCAELAKSNPAISDLISNYSTRSELTCSRFLINHLKKEGSFAAGPRKSAALSQELAQALANRREMQQQPVNSPPRSRAPSMGASDNPEVLR